MKKKNIVLIGFMGSGKSTMGIRLSYRMRRSVVDTDKLIERRQGKKISAIFAEEGEAFFRQLETEMLEELVDKYQYQIVSVGGGTPVRKENRELLKKLGTVFYLKASPESIYERVKHDHNRPLLQCENPLERIRELMEERNACYEECADYVVDTDALSIEEILEFVEVNKRGRKKDKPMKLLVINGPNLNFLGIREKSIYGTQDYDYLLSMIDNKAKETGHSITVFQSNHEGAIIDRIQEAYFDGTEGIVINPGAYTHYSYAIHDALASITIPKVEIHISDITKREEFRKISVTAPACDKQIYGQGLDGYLQAIDFIVNKK